MPRMIDLTAIPTVVLGLIGFQDNYDHKIYIDTASHRHAFEVELPKTAFEMMLGLMFRRTLAPHNGMLFVYDQPLTSSIWMANMYVPLDVLFIDECGTIVSIHDMVKPGSSSILTSKQKVKGTFEILGGLSKRLNVEVGHQLEGLPIFSCNKNR